MKKRITVWFLCLCLLLAGMPLQVLADEGEQKIQEELQQDVNRKQADKTEAEMPLQEQDKLQQKEKYTEKSLLENPAFSCTQEFPQQGVRGRCCSKRRPDSDYACAGRRRQTDGRCYVPETGGAGASEKGAFRF